MAHKTLIDGTAYEVSGGKTLIDSTAYEIDKGKTLVDGTAYEVGFGPVCRITEIYGSSFSGAFTEIEFTTDAKWIGHNPNIVDVPYGATVLFNTCFGAKIYINNVNVFTGPSGYEYGTYEYTITTDITVDFLDSEIYINEIYGNDALLKINTAPMGMESDSCATITVKGYGTYSSDKGAEYELLVPIGTEIEFTVKSSSAIESAITVNRVKVAGATKDSGPVSYTYIVNSNATIIARSMLSMYGFITFTDASLNPESTMTVTRQGSNSFVDGEYLEYDAPSGTSASRLSAGQRTVPTGTSVTCWINTKAGATSQIIVNGIVVKSGTGSYEEYSFQVSGNITIDISNYDTYGIITITK